MQLEEKEDLNMMPIPAPEDDLDSDTVATIHNPQSEDFVQVQVKTRLIYYYVTANFFIFF